MKILLNTMLADYERADDGDMKLSVIRGWLVVRLTPQEAAEIFGENGLDSPTRDNKLNDWLLNSHYKGIGGDLNSLCVALSNIKTIRFRVLYFIRWPSGFLHLLLEENGVEAEPIQPMTRKDERA